MQYRQNIVVLSSLSLAQALLLGACSDYGDKPASSDETAGAVTTTTAQGSTLTSGSMGSTNTNGSESTSVTGNSSNTVTTASTANSTTGSTTTVVGTVGSTTAGTGATTTTGAATGSGGATATDSSSVTANATSAGGTTTATAATNSTGSGGTGGKVTPAEGPCDIYEAAGTPCVGAWSTTRVLYAAYAGPLYQVRRTSDKTTMDIPQLPGGIADASVQDAFCPSDCTISRLYDQSPQGNDLAISGPVWWLPDGGVESNAKALKTTLSGYPVYGLRFEEHAPDANPPDPGNSYRNHNPTGTATGDQAEALYEVVDSRIYNGLCCNSFGNAETTGNPDGPKTMEAIYWGDCPFFGGGSGNGPWMLADLEAGTFPSSQQFDDSIASVNVPAYATLMLKGYSGDRFALKHGNAQSGALTTQWDGARPTIEFEGEQVHYTPMEKQGAIVLGSGGDGSTWSTGSFFEGAITIGVPDDDAIDQAIQANIVAAGYGL